MKRENIYIAASLLLLCTACQKEEVGLGELYHEDNFENVIDPEATDILEVDAAEQSATLKVGVNFWWDLSTEFVDVDGQYESSWLTITDGFEGFASNPFTVKVTRNVEQRERQVKFIFTSQDAPDVKSEVVFTQAAATPFIELSLEEQACALLGEQFACAITSSVEWSVEKPEWVTISKENGAVTRDEELTFDVAANNTGADREGVVKFIAKDDASLVCELALTQSGVFDSPVLSYDDSNFAVSFVVDPTIAFYDFVVLKSSTDEVISSECLERDALPEGDFVQDMSLINYGDYIGAIDVKVVAYLADDVSTQSEVVTAHSHFDLASGDGSSADSPYVVSSRRHYTNASLALGGYFRQSADLDFEGDEFSPIACTASAPFSGEWNGDDHKMLNIKYAPTATTPAAIFPYASGVVKSLTVESSIFTLAKPSKNSALFVGELLGGTVEDCHAVDCTISTTASAVTMGGIVGFNKLGVVRSSTTTGGSLTSDKAAVIGGIVGSNGEDSVAELSLIEDCENVSMAVLGANGVNSDIGGIAGLSSHTIKNSINRAKVTGARFVGGIVGSTLNTGAKANYLHIEGCANYGAISFGAFPKVATCGGIVGRLMSSSNVDGSIVTRCFNEGTISIDDFGSKSAELYVGGIAGRTANTRIIDSYNAGAVENNLIGYSYSPLIGGITSTTNGTVITNCYSVGELKDVDNSGAINHSDVSSATASEISGCYYLESLPNPTGAGEAKSDAELKSAATYVGWDFSSVWTIIEGASYPTLK